MALITAIFVGPAGTGGLGVKKAIAGTGSAGAAAG